MPDRHHPFVRDEVFPSYFANALQAFLSSAAFGLRLRRVNATTVEVVAGPSEDIAAVAIDGNMRHREATVQRAHPGGGAGTYPVFLVAKEDDIRSVPAPFSDFTDYSFDLRIEPPAGTPAIVPGTVDVFRKLGEIVWDGAAITAIRQTLDAVEGAQLADGAVAVSGNLTVTRQPGGGLLLDLAADPATQAELNAHAALSEGVHGLPGVAGLQALRRNAGDTAWEGFDPATQVELDAVRDAVLGVWRTQHQAPGFLPGGTGFGPFLLGAGTLPTSGGAVVVPRFPVAINAADLAIAGKTTQLRLEYILTTNGTAPASDFTLGLHPITGSGGGAGVVSMTMGAAVGSTVTIVAPALGTSTRAVSAVFNLPTDGIYTLGVVPSANPAASAATLHMGKLQVRHV